MPSGLRSRPEQSHLLPGAQLSRWLQAVNRSPMGVPTFSSAEKLLHSLFMIVFLEYGQIRWVIWRMLTFIKKWKWWIYNNFEFLCIFDGFLSFYGVFFGGKLTKPCRHVRTIQLVSQQSLASISNKNFKIWTKWPPVGTTIPSGAQRHHWGIGVSGFTFGSSIQSLAIPPPSWSWALPVTTCSLWSLQWAFPPSAVQKWLLHWLFMMILWEYGQNGWKIKIMKLQ